MIARLGAFVIILAAVRPVSAFSLAGTFGAAGSQLRRGESFFSVVASRHVSGHGRAWAGVSGLQRPGGSAGGYVARQPAHGAVSGMRMFFSTPDVGNLLFAPQVLRARTFASLRLGISTVN